MHYSKLEDELLEKLKVTCGEFEEFNTWGTNIGNLQIWQAK